MNWKEQIKKPKIYVLCSHSLDQLLGHITQPLCFIHGQGQISKKKHRTKNFAGFITISLFKLIAQPRFLQILSVHSDRIWMLLQSAGMQCSICSVLIWHFFADVKPFFSARYSTKADLLHRQEIRTFSLLCDIWSGLGDLKAALDINRLVFCTTLEKTISR